MKPPANRNFLPESKIIPVIPINMMSQPRYSVADMNKKVNAEILSPMYCIQRRINSQSLPLKDINDLKRVYRGNSISFNKKEFDGRPLYTMKGIGADLKARSPYHKNPEKRGLLVTSY